MRRCIESVLACAALFVVSPILVCAAIGIVLSSPGPILYRAKRAGLHGEPFLLYKLRSMRIQSEPASRITGRDDPRVFRFGVLLRKLKIDELPQLLNIVRGEMAFVGPRPEDPWIVENHYSAEDRETLNTLPGLTSPGTIYYYLHAEHLVDNGDPENSYINGPLKTKLAIDRTYLHHASLSTDLKIMSRTAWILLCVLLGKDRFPAVRQASFLKNEK